LIEAAQGGDRNAFGQLYARYAGGVSRFVSNRLQDRGAVDDLTNETFTRALRRIHSVTDQGRDVGAWFTTIARNLILDHVKSSRHRLETTTAVLPDPSPAGDDRGPEQVVIENDTAAELHRHVARLPAAQQECIRRRFMQELSVAETAVVMGRPEGAVKALQHRAIVGLRASLTGKAAVEPGSLQRETPDSLTRARRAVTEVSHHVPGDQRGPGEARAEQLTRWHTDDQAAEQQRDHDRDALSLTEGTA
jgi:RNA polymerase sigma factor (sigma-70 family)